MYTFEIMNSLNSKDIQENLFELKKFGVFPIQPQV